MKHLVFLIIVVVGLKGYGQTAKVCIAQFKEDSLRVSVNDIIKNPIVRICGLEGAKIISYELTCDINGTIYSWTMLQKDSLDETITKKLLEVNDSMANVNMLFIEQVKYRKLDNSIETAKGLSLFLAKETDCKGKYDIEKIKYKGRNWFQTKYEYYYCDNICVRANRYRRNGNLIISEEYINTPDKIVMTKFYRKDGSLMIYERKVNGKYDGDYFIYYPNGTVKLEAKNIKGIRVQEKYFDQNHQLFYEINCNEDARYRTIKYYDGNGRVIKQNTFKYKGIDNRREK